MITNVIALPVGDYLLEIWVYDPYDNYYNVTIAVTVEDTTIPEWNVIPEDMTSEFGSAFNYDVNASDLSGIDHYWIDNTSNFHIDGNGLITNAIVLPAGDYILEIRAYDPYGNYCVVTITISMEDTAQSIPGFSMLYIGVAGAIMTFGILIILNRKRKEFSLFDKVK